MSTVWRKGIAFPHIGRHSRKNIRPARETFFRQRQKSQSGFHHRLLVFLMTAVAFGYWFYGNRKAQQIESIAVLPFVNESGNADVEYLSDGMTETLIGSLSQLPKLNVKARSSVFRTRQRGGRADHRQRIKRAGNPQRSGGAARRAFDAIPGTCGRADGQSDLGRPVQSKNVRPRFVADEIARDVSNKLKAKLSGADERG